MAKLSIIIPVFNVAQYLPRSLDSILQQNLTPGEVEVILINDGSTDNSESILLRYQNQYPDIFKVISKKNEGVAATRNLGIERASGEYVYFMDPDDYLEKDGLGNIFKEYPIYENDIIYFSSTTVTNTSQITPNKVTHNVLYKGSGYDCLKRWRLNYSVCNMIVKRDFLMKHDIRFESMYIAEDILFNLECMQQPCRVMVVSDLIYYYVVRKTSAIHNRSKEKMKAAVECFSILFSRIQQVKKNNHSDDALVVNLNTVLTMQLTPLFSRILSGAFTIAEFRSIMKHINIYTNDLPESKIWRCFRFLYNNPILYPLASFFYRHIFMVVIYPFIGKN